MANQVYVFNASSTKIILYLNDAAQGTFPISEAAQRPYVPGSIQVPQGDSLSTPPVFINGATNKVKIKQQTLLALSNPCDLPIPAPSGDLWLYVFKNLMLLRSNNGQILQTVAIQWPD